MARYTGRGTGGFSPTPGPWQPEPGDGSAGPAEGSAAWDGTWTADDDDWFFSYGTVILYLLCLAISLCGLLGNGYVVWLLCVRAKRSPFLVYILNLTTADCVLLLSHSVNVTQCLLLHFGTIGYGVIMDLSDHALLTLCLEGMSLLTAISSERCVSVTFPVWYKCRRPEYLSSIVCAVIWGLSLFLGTLWVSCDIYDILCDTLTKVFRGVFFSMLSLFCVSNLTLLVRVRCSSRRGQSPRLCRLILLTVLTYVGLGLPLCLLLLLPELMDRWSHYDSLLSVFYLLSILNSAANPAIYFWVGRGRWRPGRRALGELLRSALAEDDASSAAGVGPGAGADSAAGTSGSDLHTGPPGRDRVPKPSGPPADAESDTRTDVSGCRS